MDRLELEMERVLPVGGNAKNHNELEGLGYEESGHRGFASSEELNSTKESLQSQIDTNANAIQALSEGIDPEKIDGIKDLIDYVEEHQVDVISIQEGIEQNASDIDELEGKIKLLEGGNLLGDSIYIELPQEATETIIYSGDKLLGLVVGQEYVIKYKIDGGEEQQETIEAHDNVGVGALTLDILGAGGTSIWDGNQYIDGEWVSIDHFIVEISGYEGGHTSLELVSVEVPQAEFASKESVEALDERVTALEESGNTPSGEPLAVTWKTQVDGRGVSAKNLIGATSVDWGDGTPIEDISSVATYSHTYATKGTYTAKFYGNITTLGYQAFYAIKDLIAISLPNSVVSFGNEVFGDCTALESIDLGKVVDMGTYAFQRCSSIKHITIPTSVKNIGLYTFASCYGLTYIKIPSSVTSIGSASFGFCENLKYVDIDCVDIDLPNFMFNTPNSLKRVRINNSVNSIGNKFIGTTSNVVVEILGDTIATLVGTPFNETTKIIVPNHLLNDYKNANGWSEYANRIDAYAMASDIGNINTELANIIEGEGV